MNTVPPFNWTALVLEAKKRRAQEGLSQLAHANLANVSRETIRAFDHYEKTISVAKVLDILKVVGLAGNEEDALAGDRRDFELRSLDRWRKLTQTLEKGDPATFPDGHYLFIYELIGNLGAELQSEPEKWRELLRIVPSVSGWSPFHIFTKDSLQPTVVGNELECWLGSDSARADKALTDAPHLDFWRVSPKGLLFLLRAYQEDGADSQEHGTFLDIGLPIWRAGDIIEHARLLSDVIEKRRLGTVKQVRFDGWWTGLSGRQLVDWSAPTLNLARSRQYRCRLPEVRNAVEAKKDELVSHPDATLLALVKPLYEAFGVKDEEVLDELLSQRNRKNRRVTLG
jgi:transcriptional regulator with XRE-family HTH domain